MGVVAATKRRELLNICVREIYVYSFPDPTLELSYMCMWNWTIFIRLCSSYVGMFRRKNLRVCYLVPTLKSYVGANNYTDFFTFLLSSKNVAYRISFVICVLTNRIRLTYPDIESLCEICLQKHKSDFVN